MQKVPDKLYFRDDQAAAAGLSPKGARGVTFGWRALSDGYDHDAAQTTFRVFWNDNGVWEFAPVFGPAGALGMVPGLPEAVAALRPDASVGTFCAAIEAVGFCNAATLAHDGHLAETELRRCYERYLEGCAAPPQSPPVSYEKWLHARLRGEESLKIATGVIDTFAEAGWSEPAA